MIVLLIASPHRDLREVQRGTPPGLIGRPMSRARLIERVQGFRADGPFQQGG